MSSSRDRVEDTYEIQNDSRLDELHSKLRTLRGVTTDIYEDVESQNQTLDGTRNTFQSFGASLAQSSRRASQAFGLGPGDSIRLSHLVSLLSLVSSFRSWLFFCNILGS
ncbi:t-SNARE coiled-coil homology domain-containing protein [Abortiporus biennis]